MRDFRCCASCKHYVPKERKCSRMGINTDPKWKFNCWDPNPKTKMLMYKDRSKR